MSLTQGESTANAPPQRIMDTTDTLIFRVSGGRLTLIGGSGRGAGWSGIVELAVSDEPLAQRVHGSCRPVRVSSDGKATRVIGPYWARHAVMVPVGAEHLVVFGNDVALPQPDSAFLPAAALMVADLGQIAPTKLLADELELVHAIRDLMDHRPETISQTARHIAAKAAEPLSCEVGAVLVRHHGELTTEVVTRDWSGVLDRDAMQSTLLELLRRAESGPVLELELGEEDGGALGRSQGLVARFALPIGQPPFGVLVVAHAATHARGFTNLCQRIGHALAEAAETLLVQAIARQSLAADRDRFARESRIDPVTGLENRTAWDELIEQESARRHRHEHPLSVLSVDLDMLKEVNDRLGHAAGDRLIRAAADLLRSCARSADRIARVGGDEFMVFMPDTDAEGAAALMQRLEAGQRFTQFDDEVPLLLSVGVATAEPGETLQQVVHRADAEMYAAKERQRSASATALRRAG